MEESPIRWLPTPQVDRWGTVTIGEWGGYFIQIMPMIFNDRLVMTPKRSPMFVHYGWCFPKGGAAHLAARAWNPETEANPVGFIKAVNGPRRAGETAEEFFGAGAWGVGLYRDAGRDDEQK